MESNLGQYKKKRNFKKTSEPLGGIKKSRDKLFVVQEHHASNLHYDVRLQIKGVLKSWAVPKGPPESCKDKKLAIPTEDHPLEYANFEGKISEGQYGAGQVYIWDKGTYKNLRKEKESISMEESYKQGKIEIDFQGSKLKGAYALAKIKNKNLWLLIKMK